jgi:hypothetical protein
MLRNLYGGIRDYVIEEKVQKRVCWGVTSVVVSSAVSDKIR